MTKATAILLSMMLCAGCKDPEPPKPSPWPEFPKSLEAAQILIKQRTKQKPDTPFSRLPLTVHGRIQRSQRYKELLAGWGPIIKELQKAVTKEESAVLLWGTHHDAGGQMEALRRVIGPTGIDGLTAISLEQLIADGRWKGIPAKDQRGISAAVARYHRTGDREALAAISADQRKTNYTGWKYRYLSTVTDLLTTARASGLRLLPCDMPGTLQKRSHGDVVDRLRELHCVLTMKDWIDTTDAPQRVVMAWGQGHLDDRALRRFLQFGNEVVAVYVFGHRPGPAGLEHEQLKGHLFLADPILLPTEFLGVYLLLLDGPVLGARVERAQDRLSEALPQELRHQLVITVTDAPATLMVDKRSVELKVDKPTVVALSPGPHTYLVRRTPLARPETMVVGQLTIPKDGAVELTVSPKQGSVRMLIKAKH